MQHPPPSSALLRQLAAAHRKQALVLAGLSLLSAATEGLGLVLAVPLLGALGAGLIPARITAAFVMVGIPSRVETLLVLFVILITLRAGLVHARMMSAHRFEVALVDGLRARAWRALLHCDWRTLLAMQRSASASLLISDVERVGWGVQQGLVALATAITLIGIGLTAFAIAPMMALVAGIMGTLLLTAYAGMRRRASVLGERLGEAQGAVHTSIDQGLGALRLIKSLEGEDRAARAVSDGFAEMRGVHLAFRRDQGLGQAALQIGGAMVLAMLVWLGLTRWGMSAATVLPMVALYARAVPLLGTLQEALIEWSHARPALDATLDLIARAEAAREPDDPGAPAPDLQREIAFDAVSVRHGGAAALALDAVSLVIPARGMVALTGPSGAGKSTLADLAGGLLTPDVGTMRIDGQALDPAQRRAWRRRVAYVQQEPVLLAASIRANLLWAVPGASDSEMAAALAAAAADFVHALPRGLDTPVGDGGRPLSGGERQRLMLARALLRQPALLILDEATSALDAPNEAQIARALADLKQKMAILVIGHRGALLELADRTVSLDGGRIVAGGDQGAQNDKV